MKITLKPFRLLLVVATLAVVLLFTFAATASAGFRENPYKGANKPITIQSVDPANQSIIVYDENTKLTHTYKIDGGTTITVNDNPGKLTDIVVGMQVKKLVEGDASTLSTLSVGKAGSASSKNGKGKKDSGDSSSSSN